MPTGYTAEVADGKVTDFRTFALRCARAFGATITQRDDDMSEPPKLREVDGYYATSVAQHEADLARLNAMTAEEAEAAAALAHDEAMRSRAATFKRDAETRQRYDAMLVEVEAWTPPTPEHARLKEFMIEQLTTGRDFDTGIHSWPEPTRKSGALWLAEQKHAASRSLSYAHEALARETASVESANAWITALYGSLAAESANA